jgi:hypothetical protein
LNWQPFADGETIGTTGTDDGRIVRDEEHLEGARITLEQGCKHAPFAITCGIYGWMIHTCFFAEQWIAEASFDQMKDEIAWILARIPRDASADIEEQVDAVEEAIAQFTERFA